MGNGNPSSDGDIHGRALGALARGDWPEAERWCRAVLPGSPYAFKSALILGDALAAQGRPAEAIAAYQAAEALIPGHAEPFTRIAILRFRQAHGPPDPPPNEAVSRGLRTIQMTTLGANGRFGNQLLQYAFVKLYANEHGLIAETPDWIGRDLFDLRDPFPGKALPVIDESGTDLLALLGDGGPPVLADRDVRGYFVGNSSGWGSRVAEFRRLFLPGARIRAPLLHAMERLMGLGKTLVSIHLRRQDFGYGRFWVAPTKWYLAWLRELWPTLKQPVLYIATDDVDVVSEFVEFQPTVAETLGVTVTGAEFMVDHYIMGRADHLAISNSTFSFTAAMINDRARSFVRPDPDAQRLVPFDPWRSLVLIDPVVRPELVPEFERWFFAEAAIPGAAAIYVGTFCAPWTNYVRSVRPELRVLEVSPGQALGGVQLRKRDGERYYVKVGGPIGEAQALLDWFGQGMHGSVDMLYFAIGDPKAADPWVERLRRAGYQLFRVSGRRLGPTDPASAVNMGDVLAAHPRVVPYLKLIVPGSFH